MMKNFQVPNVNEHRVTVKQQSIKLSVHDLSLVFVTV
jgi:hypothetical protein